MFLGFIVVFFFNFVTVQPISLAQRRRISKHSRHADRMEGLGLQFHCCRLFHIFAARLQSSEAA